MNPLTLSRHRHGVLVECLAQRAKPVASSNHFTLYGLKPVMETVNPDDIVVVHDFAPAQIDNNIGYYVANELLALFARPGLADAVDSYAYSEQEIFERYVGEIVRSMDGNERRAWHLFYDNTLAALRCAGLDRQLQAAADHAAEPNFIGDFGAIYQQVIGLTEALSRASLQPFTVLDVATCFGFLPLLLADCRDSEPANLADIIACDLNPALVALANDYARQRQIANVRFTGADILAADIHQELSPLAPSFDVVTAIHLLEHLEPDQTARAMINLWRLTRQRLIVAVPLESLADARFGHRQVFDRERLLALGLPIEGACRYFEHHGGWLVIDRLNNHRGSYEL